MKREEEEEEEEEKRKFKQDQQGMETHFDYEFFVSMYEFPCLVG